MRKLYFLAHKNAMIGISGTSPNEEYHEDRVFFDDAVAKMKFSEELLVDMLKDIAEKVSKDSKAEGGP